MTYEQLVTSQSSVQHVVDIIDIFRCYRCDGQPTRVYTNKAGNKVAVYFYWQNAEVPVECHRYTPCSGGYNYCVMREQHFEFVNGVVVNAKWAAGYGVEMPLYSNACARYDRIEGSDD